MIDEKLHTRTMELRFMMHLLWKATSQAMDQWLQQQGMDITRLQLGILRMLKHHGPQTISELSRHFSIDPSTLVPAVDALERKGWLNRGRDPNDRRRVPLALTTEGETMLERVPHLHDDDPLMAALDRMGDDNVVQLLTTLNELVMDFEGGEQMLKDAEHRLYAHGAKEEYLICKQHTRA